MSPVHFEIAFTKLLIKVRENKILPFVELDYDYLFIYFSFRELESKA